MVMEILVLKKIREQNRIILISLLLLVFIPLFLKIEKQTKKEKQKSNPAIWILQLLEYLY
jgi:competence protein ComGC